LTKGKEVISLKLEHSKLSIFLPFLYFLFSDGGELGSILQTLGERQEKVMKFAAMRE